MDPAPRATLAWPRDAGGRPPAALTSVGQRVLHLQLREPPTLGVWEAGSAWPSWERNLRKQPSPVQPGRWLEANPLLSRLTGSSVLPQVQNSFPHGESPRARPQRTAAPPQALLVKETSRALHRTPRTCFSWALGPFLPLGDGPPVLRAHRDCLRPHLPRDRPGLRCPQTQSEPRTTSPAPAIFSRWTEGSPTTSSDRGGAAGR